MLAFFICALYIADYVQRYATKEAADAADGKAAEEEEEDALMDGGETRKRRATPPMEKPMSWVLMMTSHWYEKLYVWL